MVIIGTSLLLSYCWPVLGESGIGKISMSFDSPILPVLLIGVIVSFDFSTMSVSSNDFSEVTPKIVSFKVINTAEVLFV